MDDIFSSLQNSIHSTALKDQTPPASKNDEEEELFAVGDITNAFGIPVTALQIPTRHLFDSFDESSKLFRQLISILFKYIYLFRYMKMGNIGTCS